MKCINCDANCFSTTDVGCVLWSGGAIPSLDIRDGDSLKLVINKLINANLDLQAKLAKCNLCDNSDYVDNVEQGTISTSGLNTASTSCSASITDTNISYSLIGNSTSVGVQYSFQNILDNLPTNFSIAKKSLKVWGADNSNTLYSTTSLSSGTFNVEPSRFPLKLDLSLLINTPCGLISIDKLIMINGVSNGSYTAKAIISDYGKEEYGNVDQATFNDIVKNKLINIERDVTSIKNLNVESVGGVQLPSKHIDTVIQTLINKIG